MRNRRKKRATVSRTGGSGRNARLKFCPECGGSGGGFEEHAPRSYHSWVECKVCEGKGEVDYKTYCQAMEVIRRREKWKERFVKKIARTEQYRHVDSIRFADGSRFRIFRLGGG